MEQKQKYNYFNFSNNKVLYDERKKRFIYIRNANKQHKRLFNKSHFKEQRPDFSGMQQENFMEDLNNGQAYLRAMMYINKVEMRRLWRTMGQTGYRYIYPIMDDYLKQHRVDSPRVGRLWTWTDSTKIVNYFREQQRRVAKYGLDNKVHGEKYTKEALKEREDELVEYFLHEMRKKPVH